MFISTPKVEPSVRKRDSPTKQFVWFENSAHLPMTEEPGKFLLFWYAPADCRENWQYPGSIALSIDRIFFVLKTLIGARLWKHCSWRVHSCAGAASNPNRSH